MISVTATDKEPFIGWALIGIGTIIRRFKITYAYVFITWEFETQGDAQAYGTITVSYTF